MPLTTKLSTQSNTVYVELVYDGEGLFPYTYSVDVQRSSGTANVRDWSPSTEVASTSTRVTWVDSFSAEGTRLHRVEFHPGGPRVLVTVLAGSPTDYKVVGEMRVPS